LRVADIGEQFRQRFGREPDVMGIAPGRVNLIGEHTDYNDGFVFPAAIDRGLRIAAAISDTDSQVFSAQMGEGARFDARTVNPGEVDEWAKYPAGMAWALRKDHPKVPNLLAVVDSNIPIGSGVSSSAAMEMAFGVVWNHLGRFGIEPARLARLGQICENEFVGVKSGIMDQMASAMGREGQAMALDTRTMHIEYAPVPHDLAVVLLDTKKPRALETSAYNERRAQCEEACRVMGIAKLRDASMELLQSRKEEMPDVVFRRARHVITENQRCLDFAVALRQGDYHKLGELMKASHVSLRDDYEVSCPELDAMAEAAWKAPGCVGARMTGAGFGGACVALVRKEASAEFSRQTLAAYDAATGLGGESMVCEVAEGAHILQA
jgi:galactokinase